MRSRSLWNPRRRTRPAEIRWPRRSRGRMIAMSGAVAGVEDADAEDVIAPTGRQEAIRAKTVATSRQEVIREESGAIGQLRPIREEIEATGRPQAIHEEIVAREVSGVSVAIGVTEATAAIDRRCLRYLI